MNKWIVSGLVSALMSLPAWAALQAGDTAPDFTLQASLNGKAFAYSLKAQLQKGPVVVYFYPSAYTGGCNIQARTFAVNADKFAAAGASVIGVSLDSIERLNKFSADPEYCAGKVAVASDAKGEVSRAFALNVPSGPGARTRVAKTSTTPSSSAPPSSSPPTARSPPPWAGCHLRPTSSRR